MNSHCGLLAGIGWSISQLRAAFLAADHSTAPVGHACATLADPPLPDSGGFSEHRSLSLPHLLRPCGLPDLRDGTAPHGSHSIGRSSGGGRHDVGCQLCFLSGSARSNYCRIAEYASHTIKRSEKSYTTLKSY